MREARYTPYGEMQRDYPVGVLPTDRRYTGQRWEGALGLYDYRARFYDPALGRFISADPVVPEPGNPQGLNRYAYVLNNPLGYIDPTGHFSEEALLHYGVFNGPRQMAGCQADELGCAAWYWALRAAEEGDWLEAWWSFWLGFHSSGMVKARGQFRVADGMLLLALESGPSYRVRFWGLQGLENPEVQAYPSGLTLEKPEGVRLYGVESLRRYVRQAEGGEHLITEWDYWEVAVGYYLGIGGHISGKVDRFDRVYVSLNVGIGLGRWGVSATRGYLLQDYDPDPAQMARAIGGWGLALQGGYYIGGGGMVQNLLTL